MRDDVVTDVQIAGFLVALLMKGPTVDEVAAIVRAMRANCVQINPKVDGILTDMCGTGGGLNDVQRQLGERDHDRLGRRPRREARQPLDLGRRRAAPTRSRRSGSTSS